MEITNYEFGRIYVDGKAYTSDLLLMGEKVQDSWWRKEGHRLQVEDLDSVVDAQPDFLVVGTGYYGRMVVPEETKTFLQSKEIRLFAAPTGEAVQELNKRLEEGSKVAGALHLTC
jgi:hypothetical protein